MSSRSDPYSDICRILDRVEIATDGYKSFAGSRAKNRSTEPRTDAAAKGSAEPPTTADDTEPVAETVARQADSSPFLATAARLLARAGAQDPAEIEPADWDALPIERSVAFAAVSGGVGSATLLANTAATLAASGERIAVADSGPSLLPFYFGAGAFRSAPASFLPQHGSGAAPVHLVTGAPRQSTAEWLLAGLHEFRSESDRLLLNYRPDWCADAVRWTLRAPVVVVLLTPEPGSLLRLPLTLDAIRRAGGNAIRPAFLLNRFDAASDLHVQVRTALAERFGEHLLPFVVRRDETFTQCLAAGSTVNALAPKSDAAQDIRQLADWIRDHASA